MASNHTQGNSDNSDSDRDGDRGQNSRQQNGPSQGPNHTQNGNNSYRQQNGQHGHTQGSNQQNRDGRRGGDGQSGHSQSPQPGDGRRGPHGHGGPSHGHRGSSNGHGGSSHGQGVRMSDVRMPTGETVKITIASAADCTCKTRKQTQLIPLRPKGKMGAREFAIVAKQMNSTIRKHVTCTFSKYNILAIQKISNCCLWKEYKNEQAIIAKDVAKENRKAFVNQRMLFHGSSHVDDILDNGFDVRHSNTAGFFGAGIYFAKDSSKSNQYVFPAISCRKHKRRDCTECVRRLLLCRVSLGKESVKTSADKLAHPPPGCHSVVGKPSPQGLKYHEYVIYKGEQAFPEYLITYKIVK